MKPAIRSKTLWANAVGSAAIIASAFGVDLGLDDPETQATLVGGLVVITNIVLRFFTKDAIELPKVKGSTMALMLAVLLLSACSGTVGSALIKASEYAEQGKEFALEGVVDSLHTYCEIRSTENRVKLRDDLAELGMHISIWSEDGQCKRLPE